MIIRFDKRITEANPGLFAYIESKSRWQLVLYTTISDKYRKSVSLVPWLRDNLAITPTEVITRSKDPDIIMTDILRWVQANITYRSDSLVWKLSERWQTPKETMELRTGDCEDGAILMYALAIHYGVPANRLLLFAGSVQGGGHCWLGYRSTEYPLNWCFMDWCYWFDRNTPNYRTKYFIKDTTIYNDPQNQYYTIWFAFSHLTSFKGIMNAAA